MSRWGHDVSGDLRIRRETDGRTRWSPSDLTISDVLLSVEDKIRRYEDIVEALRDWVREARTEHLACQP